MLAAAMVAFSVAAGCAGGGCPKTGEVTAGTDVNANATAPVINARGIDTCDVPPEAVVK
jgi:hypothetical protein